MAIDTRLTVTVSAPKEQNLSKSQRAFLSALANHLQRNDMRILRDSAASNDAEAEWARVRRCHGVIVLAFSQWNAQRLHRQKDKNVVMPTEFSHITAAMAVAAKRPLLVLREKELAERGALRGGYLPHVVKLPRQLGPEWLESRDFTSEFSKWTREMESFRHVFLGYSSQAAEVAERIRKFLINTLKLRIFDWKPDSSPGDAIWEWIERAERLTDCGIFLFMADDKLTAGKTVELAPRDNVIYEAGYFAGAKGRKNSLIILEEGARIPTDLGGILYLSLRSREDISPITTRMRKYLEQVFNDES